MTRVTLTGVRELVRALGSEARGRGLALRIERHGTVPRPGLERVRGWELIEEDLGLRQRWMNGVTWREAASELSIDLRRVPVLSHDLFELPPGRYTASIALTSDSNAIDDWLYPESGYAIHPLGGFTVEEGAVPPTPSFALPPTLPLAAR